jgi:SAM-dependent methyltransferase
MAVQDAHLNQAVRGRGPFDNFIAGFRHRLAERKLRGVASRERLLDIGCGNSPFFLIQSPFVKKFGIDKQLSSGARELAKTHGLSLQELDIERDKLPFDGDFFDAITCLAVMEHFEPERISFIFSEIFRVLRPGGVLVVTTPAFWTDGLLRILANLRLISREEIDDHKDLYTPKKIRKCLLEAGFSDSRIQCGYFECFLNTWACARKDSASP